MHITFPARVRPILPALALAAVVAAELAPSRRDAAEPAPPPTPLVAAAVAAPARPAVGRWTATLLERPLFAPGRRPPAPEDSLSSAPDAQAAPKLTGVIISPADRSAIFSLPGAARPVVAREGDALGTLTVDAIRPGEVAVSGPLGTTLWRIGLGTFVAQAEPRPDPVDETALHTRGNDGQHAE